MNFYTIFFFLVLLLTAGVSVTFLWLAKKGQASALQNQPEQEKETAEPAQEDTPAPKKKEVTPKASVRPQWTKPEMVLGILTMILVLLGLSDLFPMVDYEAYNGAFALMGVTALLEAVTYLVTRKKQNRTFRFFGKLLLVATVLELTIFQFPSYHLFFGGDYPEKTILPSELLVEAGNTEISDTGNMILKGKDEVVLTISNLQQQVGTVRVQAQCKGNTKQSKLVLDASDETHQDYRFDFATSSLVQNSEISKYISCQLSGKVNNLRVKFTGYQDGDVVQLQNIQLNAQIPFQVSLLRMALIVLLGTLAYAIVCAPLLRKSYQDSKRFCRRSVSIMTAVVMVLAVLIVVKELPDGGIKNQLKLDSGNQITQELVDAFEKKQISLLKEPSEELKAMENPYDWSLRGAQEVKAEWDHVYYEGKYYSYYGIAPVILLFLPYHAITDHYCSTNLAVLLFGLIGLLFLAMTYMAIVKRWFKEVPAGCVIAGLAILFSACGIWYSLGRTLFYEISISSGFAFVAVGAYCLFSSNVLGKGKISLVRTALASLFFGIAVLCRPTLAVYAICLCLYFLFAIPRAGKVLTEGSVNGVNRVRQIGYIICAVLPIMALGIVQMWYNTARFGSPFDFGIQYSLTINDFTHTQYQTHFVLIGLLNYLFAAPAFSADYPFITTPFSKMGVNGYYFSDNGNTSGILFLALPVLAYFLYSRSALRRLPDRKSRWKSALFVGLPCVIMPLVIICSVWESGYAIRYTADFSWEIIMGAYAILFFLYQKSQNETKKDYLRKFMAFSMIAAILVNGIQIFNFTFPADDYPTLCSHLEQLIAFWK